MGPLLQEQSSVCEILGCCILFSPRWAVLLECSEHFKNTSAGGGLHLALLPAVWSRDGRPWWPAGSVASCLE